MGLESTFHDGQLDEEESQIDFDTNYDYTDKIYDHINKGEFKDAIGILACFLRKGKRDKAVYSVLAYCYFQLRDYENSAKGYAELVSLCPENSQYKFYYAQWLFKISEFSESLKVCEELLGTSFEQDAVKLMAAIYYEKGNFFEAKKNLRRCSSADFSSLVNKGWIYFKEGDYERAYAKFKEAQKISGFNAELFYNLSLWVYEQGEYDEASMYVKEIIDQAFKRYPQLMVTEEHPVFETNKQKAAEILRETAIVEAINLKAAILFIKEEYAAAKKTIKRVPAINEGGIDPVTFHNQALFFVTENSADSIKKMSHLLRDCLFPPETFQNLLFLYWKYFFYDLASELITENPKFCK